MNILYDIARQRMLINDFNWPSMSVALVAWRGPYTFMETNMTVADVTLDGGQLVQTGLPFLNMAAMTGGYAKSDNAVIPNVPASASPVTFLTLVEPVGLPNAARLIAYIDEAIGLPFIPNGQDETVQPDWLQLRGWFRP